MFRFRVAPRTSHGPELSSGNFLLSALSPSGCLFILLLLCMRSTAAAHPGPAGGPNIPRLLSQSTLVCRGEVIEAPIPELVLHPPRLTGKARFKPDRCYKGAEPQVVEVLVDKFAAAGGYTGGSAHLVLRKGDYLLLFLQPQADAFTVVDVRNGALEMTRETAALPKDVSPALALELDLEAGLADHDVDLVLANIDSLGSFHSLCTPAPLRHLLQSRDQLVRAHVWNSLLKLGDMSVLPEVEEFFAKQPQAPRRLFLPGDRLLQMQWILAASISHLRSPESLPFLERSVSSHNILLRDSALGALREISSPHSAPIFLQELDDTNSDNAFSAMHALFTLAGNPTVSWVPSWQHFSESPAFFATKTKEWWWSEGRQLMLKRQEQRRWNFQ